MRAPLQLTTTLVLALALVAAACDGDDDEEPEAAAAELPLATVQPAPEPGAEPAVAPPDQVTPAPEPGPEPSPEPDATTDPDRERLAYGDSVEATIEAEDEVRQFRFDGAAGELVRISVDGKDGMDPVASLLEPNRTEIATNDDLSPANRDSLIIARLPSGGLQVVRVEAFDEASVGRFVITVERLPEDLDYEPALIDIGGTVQGMLGDLDDIDEFRFSGEAEQRVVVVVDGAIGVDTIAELFDPDLVFLLKDDDGGHALDAELLLQLPTTGTYQVQVASVSRKLGPYQISVRLQEEAPTADPAISGRVESVANTYLDAIQQGDAVTLFALAGPEALDIWGWESADDVSRDLQKLRDVGVGGTVAATTSELSGARSRATIELDGAGDQPSVRIRFDLIEVDGQWLVDFVQRLADLSAAG